MTGAAAALAVTLPAYRRNPGQRRVARVLRGPQRHTLCVAGSRSGKTTEIVRTLLVRAVRAPGSRHAIIRHRFNAVRASVWLDTLPKVARLCFPGLKLTDHRQEGYVSLPNGSEIWFLGLDDPGRVDKVLGLEFASIFFNECSQIPYESVLVALTRLAQKTELRQRAYFDLNPVGQGHWTYRLFTEGRDPASRAKLANPEDYARCAIHPSENAENLDPAYLASLAALPEKSRRRFWDGEYVAEIDGALWSLDSIDSCRCAPSEVPALRRVVVAVDPSGADGDENSRSDAIGIVAAGIDAEGVIYLLDDATFRAAPEVWAVKTLALYDKHRADAIIGEANYGGDMVRAVIHAMRKHAPYKAVSASRGKHVRAEPVAALYGAGRVRHAGRYPELEDELGMFSTAGYMGTRSPNRADAWVWAATELMGGDPPRVAAVKRW